MLSICYVKSIDFEQKQRLVGGSAASTQLGLINPPSDRYSQTKYIKQNDEGGGGKAPSPPLTLSTHISMWLLHQRYTLFVGHLLRMSHHYITPLQLLNSNVYVFHISAQLFYVKPQLLYVTPYMFNMKMWASSLKIQPLVMKIY